MGSCMQVNKKEREKRSKKIIEKERLRIDAFYHLIIVWSSKYAEEYKQEAKRSESKL